MTATNGSVLGPNPSNTPGFDYSNHDNFSGKLLQINIAFIITTAVILTLRTGVRLFLLHSVGHDDVLMLFAGMNHIAFSALNLYGISLGVGKHVWDIAPPSQSSAQLEQIGKVLFACQILYATATACVKLSIIACYRRVFPNDMLQRLLRATTILITAMWICSIFVVIFACNPVQSAWQFSPTSKCINIVTFYIVATAVNGTLDLVLCIAPLPFIYKIRIATREKVILSLLFTLGFFASAASWVRLSHLHELRSGDISSSVTNTLDWSSIEVGIGIFCASVPSLRPLLARIMPYTQTFLPTRGTSKGRTASRVSRVNALELESRSDQGLGARNFNRPFPGKAGPQNGTSQISPPKGSSSNGTKSNQEAGVSARDFESSSEEFLVDIVRRDDV